MKASFNPKKLFVMAGLVTALTTSGVGWSEAEAQFDACCTWGGCSGVIIYQAWCVSDSHCQYLQSCCWGGCS